MSARRDATRIIGRCAARPVSPSFEFPFLAIFRAVVRPLTHFDGPINYERSRTASMLSHADIPYLMSADDIDMLMIDAMRDFRHAGHAAVARSGAQKRKPHDDVSFQPFRQKQRCHFHLRHRSRCARRYAGILLSEYHKEISRQYIEAAAEFQAWPAPTAPKMYATDIS